MHVLLIATELQTHFIDQYYYQLACAIKQLLAYLVTAYLLAFTS